MLNLLFVCAILAAQTGEYSSSGSSWSSRGDDSWRIQTRYREITGYQTKPEEAGVVNVEFFKPKLDALGNHCQITGRVNVTLEKFDKPVGWFQGITVYLAKVPEQKCDWSSGISSDAVAEQVILQNDGTFEVEFDLRETSRIPAKLAEHQIAISLATHDAHKAGNAQTVVWESKDPAVKETVKMFELPASPEIPRELRLIDLASGWPFSDADGVKVIRAVNALRPLGKKRSLKLLQEYTESLSNTFDDVEIVFWIIRILFEPADVRKQIPSPAIAVYFDSGDKGNSISKYSILWPLDPIELSHDVPFMLGRQIGMGGRPEHPMSHIAWAVKFGVLRETALVPENPLLAAERLLSSKKFKRIPQSQWSNKIDHVRKQAIAMSKAMEVQEDHNGISDAQWNKLLTSAAAKKFWDVKLQEFVSPK